MLLYIQALLYVCATLEIRFFMTILGYTTVKKYATSVYKGLLAISSVLRVVIYLLSPALYIHPRLVCLYQLFPEKIRFAGGLYEK